MPRGVIESSSARRLQKGTPLASLTFSLCSLIARFSWRCRSVTEVTRRHFSERAGGLKGCWDAAAFRLRLNSLLSPAAASSSSLPSICAIHCHILKSGSLDVVPATILISALGRCGDLRGARKLFDEMPNRDIPAWNAMLVGYIRSGNLRQAYALVRLMFLSGMRPNSVTLSILLQLSSDHGDTSLGRCIHCYLWRHAGISDTFLHNSLLVCYLKLGRLDIAEYLFDEIGTRDIVTWNAMISGYTMKNRPEEALRMSLRLRQEGQRPDIVTLETTLHACAHLGEEAISEGQLIHSLLVRMGFPADFYTDNSLLLMYCKCGWPHTAQHLFDTMTSKNTVSWSILVNGYVQKFLPHRAVTLFRSALSILSEVSSELMVGALNAIKQLSPCPQLVVSFHGVAMVLGLTSDEFVISSLISAYGKQTDMAHARRCLDYVLPGNGSSVPWNALLSVYLHSGFLSEAVEVLHLMQREHIMADAVTVVNALCICARLQDRKLGRSVHGYAIRNRVEGNSFVSSSLLEFYSNCLLIGTAWRLFLRMPSMTTASCNAIIFGCSQNGYPAASLWLFHMMMQLDNVKADATTVVGMIEAISLRGDLREGAYIHNYAIEEGFLSNEFVANPLISMHWKFGDLQKVNEVFTDGIGHAQSTWNVMIMECSNHDRPEMAVSIFHCMKHSTMCPDEISLLSLLPSCGKLASLHCVMWAHTYILKVGCGGNIFVATSLSDAYAKCGELLAARQIFNAMKHRTTTSWNCMIRAYGMSGDTREAGKLFHEMLSSGTEPNPITFLALISSCGHAGEVAEGLHYHHLMTSVYSMSPEMEHYACIIDLLGRRGMIDEAFEFLEKIPLLPAKCAWGSILGACRAKGKMSLALAAAERLFELDPFNHGYNTLLSGILAESGRWVDAFHVRKKLSLMGQRNMQGLSIIEV